jgi:nucleotide-binding universal stress UspA family protein
MAFKKLAESLILQSTIPLLIVNPKVQTSKKIKTVLFPTDLGDASERDLKKLIPYLKRLNAKIVLYHKMDYVLPETYSMIYRSEVYERYLKEDETKRKTKLEAWAKKLQTEGIKYEIVIDNKPSFIPKSIVAASTKHKAQLIAIVSHTSSTNAMFLGSISRQVVRLANCPIWSWHTSES